MWNAKPAGNMEISMYLASNLPHMQTFGKMYRNFHVPCNETYVTLARCMEISMYLEMKHMVWYMEISMYLAMKHIAWYMEVSMYVSCDETYGMVHGNFPLPCNEIYGKVHGNFHVPWEPFALETYGRVHGHFIPCHMFRCKVPCQWYCEKVYVSVYPCCPKKHGIFCRPALMSKRTLKRFTLLILSPLRQCIQADSGKRHIRNSTVNNS